MKSRITRRGVVGGMLGLGAVAMAGVGSARNAIAAESPAKLKGRIHHSVCRWCYGGWSFDQLCQNAVALGITGIDLLGPSEWPTLAKYGLKCAIANAPGVDIAHGFNHVEDHDRFVKLYESLIPQAAEAGIKNVICLSGNRAGIDDEQGMKNCVVGIQRIIKLAEKHNVTIVMELLNSKVDHHDYQCDHTAWGVELCKRIGSKQFKLLYDIYHMQIMEGDLIATIKKNIQYIAHFHTGGVPGRAEIDSTQEINYPAVMKAIVATGYQGFVAQEFIPKHDPLTSLRQAIEICDV
jgi:hydroxypyruvate isomerase